MRDSGECFCGAVHVKVSGTPVAMGFCHCISCGSWSAAPVNAFTLWKADQVSVTKGEDNLAVFHRTESVSENSADCAAVTLWPNTRTLISLMSTLQ